MKPVLFIAYEFPPAGGIEVQRIVKFIKYIRDHDINPIVLTTSHGLSRFMDYRLLDNEYIKNTQIIRLGGAKTYRYHKFKNEKKHPHHPYIYYLGIRYIWFQDIYSSWFFELKNYLKDLITENFIKAIYTTSPPASTHLIGNYISKYYRIPWIMDIRDSMVNNPNYKRTIVSNFSNSICTYYEKQFCENSDRIISVSQPIIDNMANRVGRFVYEKSHVIMNGYDQEDFSVDPTVNFNQKKLHVIYTGSFLGRITPYYFLEALKILIQDRRINSDDIKLTFVGQISNEILNLFDGLNHLLEIDLTGPVSHSEALAYQRQSDLLLLLLAPVEDKYASEVISGKIFEYMAANKPVLGLIPDGPLQNIFKQTRIGYTAKPHDVDDIADTFKNIYKQWQEGGIDYQPNHDEIQNYTREKQTELLAQVIHELI